MKLGLEGLVESKEENVCPSDIEVQVLESEYALQELLDTQDSIETIEEIAEIIKEYGFDASMEQLFGDELTEQGIDITQPKEDLAMILSNIVISNERVDNDDDDAPGGNKINTMKLVAILSLIKTPAQKAYLEWLKNIKLLSGKVDLKSVPKNEWNEEIASKHVNGKILDAKVAIELFNNSMAVIDYIKDLQVEKKLDTAKIIKLGENLNAYYSKKKKKFIAKDYVLRNSTIDDLGWNTDMVLKLYDVIAKSDTSVEQAIVNIRSHSKIAKAKDYDETKWLEISKKIGDASSRRNEAKMLKSILTIAIIRSRAVIGSWMYIVKLSKIARRRIKEVK